MTDTSTVQSSKHENELEDSKRVYEVGYLLLPSIPEEHIPKLVADLKEAIENAGGVSLSEEDPKLRPLAYEMVKHIGTENVRFNTAYFGSIKFEVAAGELPSIKTKLDAMDSMLRALIMKIPREMAHVSRPVFIKEANEAVEEAPVGDEEITLSSEPASQDELDKSIDALIA
jgi:ribosomal protein S6